MEIDEILANIIEHDLGLTGRVVIEDLNYSAPKDGALYATIATDSVKTISSPKIFDETTLKETQSFVGFITMIVKLFSKNRDAYTRKEEVIMALKSTYSIQQQLLNSCKLFRTPNPLLNLPYIEGSSAFHRSQIYVIGSYFKTKTVTVDYFEYFRENQYLFNRK